ncbi:hypothetical protein [Phytohabitans kaempferiae]|uniref:VWFA domain-containing protein n=1 Tax=Phytohabitans kaempferiae TaxID=1620943 RepID=A0ABV6MF25_9ACTN
MTVPLILRSGPVTRLDRNQRTRDPNIAVVYATADGRLELLDDGRPVGLADQVTGRFRKRYEVDIGDHQHTVELRTSPPPAQGGVYYFQTFVNIGFRVTDPMQVVRRNVDDGLKVVTDYLMAALRDITAAFPIEAAKEAEDAVNARFRHGVTIEGYLELYLCRTRLQADPAAVEYLRREQDAKWDNQAKVAEHDRDADDAQRQNSLDLIRQGGSLEQRARERDALAGRPFSMQDLLALHIESNPGDTARVIEMAVDIEARQAAYREEAEKRNWERFRYLADKNLVQPPEMGQVREGVLSGVAQPPPIAATSSGNGWDDPLPDPHHPGAAPGPADLPGLIPVYLVVDESSAMAASIEALNAGLQSLYGAVTGDPEIAEVVRLAVVSYADDAAVRMAPHAARSRAQLPAFTVGPGPARLSAAFELLRECVSRDATALKRETSSLRRPQVLLLCGGQPADDPQWMSSHNALVDRASQRYAPEVTACGVGSAPPATVLGIATQPELAFVDQTGDLVGAVDRFWAFARRRVAEYGRAVLDGDQNPLVTSPDGFRPAAEPAATPTRGE